MKSVHYAGQSGLTVDGNVSLGDILPNLLSEIYALVKKGNYWKYIDRIFYISLVKITPNVC